MNETEVLFTRLLNCDRLSLYLDKGRRLTREQSLSVAQALARRAGGEPLEYILGSCEFMGREFHVDRRVLIPRADTEILVETAVRYADMLTRSPQRAGLTILDVGTGSGCVAVSLSASLPGADVVAADISPEALAVARANAERNGCAGRVRFACADLLDGCGLEAGSCDIIVSNPPYIATGDIEGLQPEVRREPRAALDGGRDGLDFYRRIVRQAPRYLAAGGVLVLEMGFGQRGRITQILEESRRFSVRETVRDLSGIERVIVGEKTAG